METQSQFTFEEMSKIYSCLNSGTRALSISPDITRFINGELPDIRTIFNIKDITGQYLDAYGKVRILRYKNFDIILTLPTIPLAVPIIDKYDKADNTYDDTLDMIKETRNEFKSNQYNTTGNLILGVWFFNAKHKLTFFTRCIPEEEKKSAEEKNNLRVPVISLNNMSALQSLQSARRNTFFLLQFIKYLFGLYVNRTSGDVSAANFINEYTVVNPEAVYDSKSITQWLPNTPKLGSALKELTSSYPGFFSERKLVLKSEALKEKLIKHLQKLEKEYEGINVNVINKMDNYYKNVTDFHTGVDVFVFLDEPSITRWLRQKIIAEYPLEIYNNVREFVYEPYIFIYGTKKYIIQNVKDGSKERATKCAENWLRLKINTGFRTVIRNVQLQATIWTTIPNFMIEEAANTGIEIVKFLERVKGEEEEDVDDEDIEGEDIENKVRYAAMLPLE